MMRIMGAAIVLLSAVAYLFLKSRALQEQEKLVQDILDSIEEIETSIRWENRTLPDSIETRKRHSYAGDYFLKISENMKSEITLQEAWINVFSTIQPKELSTILCGVLLTGDSTFLLNRLAQTARQIREFQKKEREEKREKGKLRAALALSTAGLVVILLL